eukprot:4269619-Pyramimonas_sp.AAC.1
MRRIPSSTKSVKVEPPSPRRYRTTTRPQIPPFRAGVSHSTAGRTTQHRVVIRAAVRLINHPLLEGVSQLEPCSWGRG